MIIQPTETGIDQYFQRDVEAENWHEAFDQVADYLRGLIGLDELLRTTEIQTFPLNPQELERKLTGDTGRKLLMTVNHRRWLAALLARRQSG